MKGHQLLGLAPDALVFLHTLLGWHACLPAYNPDCTSLLFESYQESGTLAELRTTALMPTFTSAFLRFSCVVVGKRAHAQTVIGDPSGAAYDLPDASVDAFVSTYVLDILSDDDIEAVLSLAHR